MIFSTLFLVCLVADPSVDSSRICILFPLFCVSWLFQSLSFTFLLIADRSRSQFNMRIIFTEMNHYRIIKITKIEINYCNSAHIRHFHTRRCQPKYFIRIRSVTARCLPLRFLPSFFFSSSFISLLWSVYFMRLKVSSVFLFLSAVSLLSVVFFLNFFFFCGDFFF